MTIVSPPTLLAVITSFPSEPPSELAAVVEPVMVSPVVPLKFVSVTLRPPEEAALTTAALVLPIETPAASVSLMAVPVPERMTGPPKLSGAVPLMFNTSDPPGLAVNVLSVGGYWSRLIGPIPRVEIFTMSYPAATIGPSV